MAGMASGETATVIGCDGGVVLGKPPSDNHGGSGSGNGSSSGPPPALPPHSTGGTPQREPTGWTPLDAYKALLMSVARMTKEDRYDLSRIIKSPVAILS